MNNVPPQLWMQLEKEIRIHLAEVFQLQRTGPTEVRDNVAISDGFSVEDLKGITVEKMNAYIGSEETLARGWELSCSKARYELHPPMEMSQATASVLSQNEELEKPVTTTQNATKTKKN